MSDDQRTQWKQRALDNARFVERLAAAQREGEDLPAPDVIEASPVPSAYMVALRREVCIAFTHNGPPVPGEDAKLRAKSAAAVADLAVAYMPTPAHLEG